MAESLKVRERTAKVKIVLWTSKTLADGSHPFVVRIHKDGTRKHITTGYSLHPQYWNAKKQEIRQSYPSDKRKALEKALQAWKDRFTDAAEEYSASDSPHDAESIVHKVADERKHARQFKLLSYFDELISQFEKTGNVGNRKVYRDVQNNLTRYIGEGKDVSFDQVTVKFCNGWETKMRSEGLTDITLSVKFRTLRAVLNKAIANGYAKYESYPFARNTAETHKFQVGKFDTKTTKRAISKADIRKIESFEPAHYVGPYASLRDTSTRLRLARDLFLFSYYCGGINFVDIALLQWSNIGTDLDGKPRLSYIRQKTGGRFSIRLVAQALAILERYKVGVKQHPTEYVFPILHSALHKTPTQKHNRSSKIMGQVNKDLKTIGAEMGISTPLTTYVARHSFATALKRSGVATGIISEAMGHQDERTTQIYLSEFDTDLVDAAFDNL
ncbi:site-specific integrase [Spirosoma panaciterrae]|uniref:site-specific integrase n=1 Tax=Spirosoma panaciterrae TaxID=496058 RepID=UPI0003763201|nr:site-specific integrase [Spirosoma panaciterrae]